GAVYGDGVAGGDGFAGSQAVEHLGEGGGRRGRAAGGQLQIEVGSYRGSSRSGTRFVDQIQAVGKEALGFVSGHGFQAESLAAFVHGRDHQSIIVRAHFHDRSRGSGTFGTVDFGCDVPEGFGAVEVHGHVGDGGIGFQGRGRNRNR